MTNTRKTMTAFAAIALAVVTFGTLPASAAGFTLEIGGPLNLPPLGDGSDFPDTAGPQLHFDMQLEGKPVLPRLTRADIEQARHQCEVVKKIKVLLEEMHTTLEGYYRINDLEGARQQIKLIDVWTERLEITKRDCYKIFV